MAAQSSTAVFLLAYFLPVHVAVFFFLLVLDLLDRVRSGFFEAVHLAPPACTWSRPRNVATEGQAPLRSRSEPLGPSSLKHPEVEKKPQEIAKVMQSNREWERVLWLINQSASCRKKKIGILLVFPEDFEGHVNSGPASPWSARDVHNIVVTTGALERDSVFYLQQNLTCRFAHLWVRISILLHTLFQ